MIYGKNLDILYNTLDLFANKSLTCIVAHVFITAFVAVMTYS